VSEFVDVESAERVAVVFYGLALLGLAVSLTLLVRYAFGQRELLREHVEESVAAEAARYRPSYIYYGVAIAIGLVLPFVAVALYLAIALYFAVPARTIRRLARVR
jgi:hypothetical protein